MIRAFKSTLEDLEEKRSEHSVHSLRSSRSQSGLRPLSDITYIDEDPLLRGSVSASAMSSAQYHHHRLQSPGERELLRDRSHTSALATDGLVVGSGAAASGADWERDRHHANHQRHHHHQQQQRHASVEHANNNNRATERKGGGSGGTGGGSGGGGGGGAALNGHRGGNSQPASLSHSNSQVTPIPVHVHDTSSPTFMPPSMSPPQLLASSYQTVSVPASSGPTSLHYQLPAQLPPSGLLPVRYDVLNYDSLPDLPADLPRLVHETSI